MAKSANFLTRWLTTIRTNKKVDRDTKSVSYWSLYRYATPLDYILIAIALVTSAVEAVSNSIFVLAYGDFVAMLVDRNFGLGASTKTITLSLFGGGKLLSNATHEENMAELRNDSWAFGTIMIIIAVIALLTGTIAVDLMNFVGLRMVSKLRQAFFEASIRKDIGWHDVKNNQNFALHMTDSMEKIRCAISEKLTLFTYLVLITTISLIIAFICGPKLTSALFGLVLITVIGNIFSTTFQKKFAILEQSANIKAANLSEEIFSAIRTVAAFCGENLECRHYDALLISARKAGKFKSYFSGLLYTLPRFMLFLLIASIIGYGSRLILQDRDKIDREYTPAVIAVVYYGIIIAVEKAGQFSPCLDCFLSGVTAAGPIFEVIDSSKKIDPLSSDGKVLKKRLNGDIEFRDVFFKYPSRDEASVLGGLNLKVKKGQTVAIVGHSGCGKSTCLQLLQRFYDATYGDITVDELDIRKYNVSYLRSNMAIVGQEPFLFQGTIGENIRYGKPDAAQRDIEIASQSAGAHDFISKLSQGYNTSIVEKGIQLSGGQKQRIAIARALISNPTILLLDEATSALDYHSEKAVQRALDKACRGRTTIVVSHRLSAIKNADKIFFVHEGKVLEEGSHDELVNLHGRYFEMIKSHIMNDDGTKEQDTKQNEDYTEISSGINSDKLDKHWPNLSLTDKNIDEDRTGYGRMQFINTFGRIVQIGKENRGQLIIAMICASVCGCAKGCISLIMGEYYETLTEMDEQVALSRISSLVTICLVIAVILAVASFIESCFTHLAGIDLTTKLKSLTFKTIISQEIGWFDDKRNSVGALSARLSGDAAGVQHVIGQPLIGFINVSANLITGISIAFYFSWQTALVCLCSATLMIGPIVFEAIYVGRRTAVESNIIQKLSQFATEAIANIRTVASLRRERQMIADFNKEVSNYTKELGIILRFRGIIYASQFATMYLGYGIGLSYGGILCSEGVIRFSDVTRVGAVLQYGLMLLALTLAFCQPFVSGLIAANRLFWIIDRKPQVKSALSSENSLEIEKPSNAVKYRDVFFHYPSRPDRRVLNGLNFEVLQGKTVALVGPSGCGKSTCFELLLRYYDLCQGEISLEDQNIHRDVTLTTLRSKVGIVSQEPTLLGKSIAGNIAYGDNSREVTMPEIIEAAKLANAYAFIIALPNGFETVLGARGTQLSGGQKQRIAIARALIKNPKVLLLDEATSALDFQSEKIVQSALDRAVSGRTCIVIAHRLDTIQNADLICVVEGGVIIEQGNHLQLLEANGAYTKLYKSQWVG